MASRTFSCYAHGKASSWEAICVDLDIAVQGQTFTEVFDLLNEAISTYVEDAMNEDRETAIRLLHRRAPFSVRMSYLWGAMRALLSRRNGDGNEAHFGVHCPA
jgi:hypothetical protein